MERPSQESERHDQSQQEEGRSLEFGRYEIRAPADLLVASLSATSKVVFLTLLAWCPDQTGEVVERWSRLARRFAMDRHTLRRHIVELVESGWLRVERTGRSQTRFVMCNPVLAEREAELERVQARLSRARFGGEALMREWLNLLVDSEEYHDNARPGFLRNPLTGENLEYDRWYSTGVAFEFNGPQHYRPTDLYSDLRQVEATQARDLMKKGISQEQGVVLITVEPQDLTLERMQAKIAGHLPLRKIRCDDPVLRFLAASSERYMFKAGGEWRRKRFPQP